MATPQQEQEINVISKLTTKTIGANPRRASALKEGDKSQISLYQVYGKGRMLKQKEGNNGEMTTAICGNFEAVNTESGEIFRSGVLYLPKGITEFVEAAISKLKDEADSVDFAFEVFAVRADNPIGYSYIAKPILKPTESDDLSNLRKLIQDAKAQKALAAPAAGTAAKK